MQHAQSFATVPPSPDVAWRNNAALLGDIAWLMLRLQSRRDLPIRDFARLVMPPLARRQFRLFYDRDVPVAYVSWARLSADAETRFIADPFALEPADWASGETVYIVDFVAAKGAMRKIMRALRRDPLISERPITGIRMRGDRCKTVRISAAPGGFARIAARLA